jgi:hypothetical protein
VDSSLAESKATRQDVGNRDWEGAMEVKRIRATFGDVVVTAVLNESSTARQLWEALPVESQAQRWGDEVYLKTPVEAGEEDPQADVPSGAVAYWPPGKALCFFFGQKPYSPVNVVGEVEGDAGVLSKVGDGAAVRVEAA